MSTSGSGASPSSTQSAQPTRPSTVPSFKQDVLARLRLALHTRHAGDIDDDDNDDGLEMIRYTLAATLREGLIWEAARSDVLTHLEQTATAHLTTFQRCVDDPEKTFAELLDAVEDYDRVCHHLPPLVVQAVMAAAANTDGADRQPPPSDGASVAPTRPTATETTAQAEMSRPSDRLRAFAEEYLTNYNARSATFDPDAPITLTKLAEQVATERLDRVLTAGDKIINASSEGTAPEGWASLAKPGHKLWRAELEDAVEGLMIDVDFLETYQSYGTAKRREHTSATISIEDMFAVEPDLAAQRRNRLFQYRKRCRDLEARTRGDTIVNSGDDDDHDKEEAEKKEEGGAQQCKSAWIAEWIESQCSPPDEGTAATQALDKADPSRRSIALSSTAGLSSDVYGSEPCRSVV